MNLNFLEELGKAVEKTINKERDIKGIKKEEVELTQK